ncbi:MAG TPA: hypothetical protein VMA86_01135, partial [Acetobacteraceae bacterium]|nr:hypothetical protein [Acetobacteraceae bacterium]
LRAAGIGWRRLWLLIAEIARAEAGGKDSPAEREALRAAATAEPDPAWRCGECGGETATWQPLCPHCGTAGRLTWEAGSRPLTPLALPAPAAAEVEVTPRAGRSG